MKVFYTDIPSEKHNDGIAGRKKDMTVHMGSKLCGMVVQYVNDPKFYTVF
jgi:hypothetical protein